MDGHNFARVAGRRPGDFFGSRPAAVDLLLRAAARAVPILALVAAFEVRADITGTVFRDFDANGSRAAGEPGLAGVVVNAYSALGTAVGNSPQTSGADGTYTLSALPPGPLRLEFTLPPTLSHFRPGVAGETSVVFSSDGATVDTGFLLPVEFCQADPQLFTTCFVTFDNLNAFVGGGAYDNRDEPVSVAVAYSANSTTPATSLKVPAEQMGSTFGVAWQSATGRLFTASYVKSIAGLGPDGVSGTTTGGLYEVTPGGGGTATAALFLDLDGFAGINTGADPHPSPAATCTSGIVAGTTNQNCWLHDPATFAAVGKRGLGDLDFNSDETRLYTVNLADRTLVMLPLGVPAAVPAPGAVEVFPTPSNCPNAADARPFALARHDHPNRMYLGVTCTAQSSQSASELAVWIYEFDRGTGPGTETYTAIFSGSLAYPRLRATGFFGGACTAANCPATWRPWQDDFTLTNQHNENPSLAIVSHPQPLVTDFAFDGLDLVLAIRDRSSDQGGDRSGSPANIADTLRRSWFSAGDLVRACDTDGDPGTIGWTFELNGTCGGVNGSGLGNGDGFGTAPNNGEFYFDEILTGGAPGHSELFFGSVAQIPGRDTVGATMMDATAFNEGVVSTWRHTNGGRATAARVYLDGFDPFFGKANGLGDLEALCAPAPLELGNRVWCDTDADGVQDAGENGVSGIEVGLQCGAGNPASATTDAQGRYLFTDASYGAANSGALIPRNASCTLSIDTTGANGAALLSACGTTVLSPLDNGGADAGEDLRDSDGTLVGTTATIAVTTGGPGANNHSFDQGFGAPPVDFGDAPDTYGTTLAANGPRHTVISGFSLGATEDSEADGQPNVGANGDGADEDGVVILGGMPGACSTGNALTVTLTNSAGAATPRLDAWIDWNGDGDFDHPAEHLFGGTSANLAPGVNNLTYAAPCSAVAQAVSYARFRLSSAGSLTPVGGPAADGEVEDYTVQVKGVDFGDAPNTYGTTLAANGPHHTIIPGFSLGTTEDGEADGQPNVGASGDGADEDGVVFVGGAMAAACTTGNELTVTLTNSAGQPTPRLDAWIDWNGDGDFDHPAEHLFAGTSQTLSAGANTVLYNVPCTAVAQAVSYARFRLSSAGSLSPLGGLSANGEVEDYAFMVKASDFGDAPDTYGTTLAANGALHPIVPGFSLGTNEDGETNGQPNPTATGDDTAGSPDDEDGITFAGGMAMAAACSTGNSLTATLTNSAGLSSARLDAWIDWNGDGVFAHPSEHLFGGTSASLAAGANLLSYAVPCTAQPQTTSYARFRLSSAGSLLPTGPATDGEVEDSTFQVKGVDFGDAPAPYPTLFASNGAHHTVLPAGNPTLGVATDTEAEGQPSASHNGDDANGVPDDEDGVSFAGVMIPGTNTTVTVTGGATGGLLDAWIDWNRDGDWSDPGEQIATAQPIAANATVNLTVPVPTGAVSGTSCARFRISTAGGLAPTGPANDGEIEDYGVALGVEEPSIGVAKRVVSVTEVSLGHFRVVYEIMVTNTGNVKLSNVQVTTHLAAAYAGAISWSADGVVSADFALNAGYNGDTDINLLAGTDMLDVGGVGLVELAVIVEPGTNVGPYFCNATATADSPAGTPVDDMSQDGNDPDPDGNGDPGDNEEPTPVGFPLPGIEIPTLGEWGLMLLVLLLAAAALATLRKAKVGAL